MQGDINVRLRHQVALDGDNRILRCQRSGHQQCRQELAGDAAVHLNVAASKTTAKAQWWVILLLQILNLRTALTKGIHQMADRTLFHARLAGQNNVVAAQTQGGSQWTHGGSRVTQKQLQFLG